jgi:hypothetical protein
MRAVVLGLALVGAAGCKTDPYCLTCGDGSLQDGGTDAARDAGDMLSVDLSGPDLSMSDGGPCIPSNGGVEKCDGIDNDCNGIVDDVDPAKLAMDPNNCGKCGVVCQFNALKRFGQCIVGDMGTPGCAPVSGPPGCFPGYVNPTPTDPNAACSYQCTITNGGVEICDGKDNDCNGKIDDPFTATYDGSGNPNYDSDIANCGACGFGCNLPHAVSACTAGTGGKGTCTVDHCINSPGVATYKHNPANGDINVTGCEYQCPIPTTTVTTGSDDCDKVACAFPNELCNGLDDNCDFKVDNPPFDVSDNIGGACGENCPGGTMAGCIGACMPGTYACNSGVKQCSGGTQPTVETCDGADNDCNGKIDDPFTKTWTALGVPNYDLDPQNCGSCGHDCNTQLANAVTTCSATFGSGGVGACGVLSCKANFNYVNKPACSNAAPGPENGTSGVGCWYACPVTPPLPTGTEICDGKDNDCNGCIDDSPITPPNFCSKLGVCSNGAGGSKVSPTCKGAAGWVCDYRGVANVEADAVTGALLSIEQVCDGFDGNCNGTVDLDGFPTLGQNCSAGVGVCQQTGKVFCDTNAAHVGNPTYKKSACLTAAGGNYVVADNTKRTDELCDGKDNDCDGLVDERTDTVVGGVTYKGWRDAMVQIGGVYVYSYEASRIDATATGTGGGTARACSQAGVLPWNNVTKDQADSYCASVLDSLGAPMFLCSAPQWQTACENNTPQTNAYSYSASPTVYQSGVCNDANNALGKPWPTGHDNGKANKCDTPAGTGLFDMSGNLMEWTSTNLTVGTTTYYKIRGGAYTSPSDGVPPDGTSCEFDFVIAQSGFLNADVGFRCCSTNAP